MDEFALFLNNKTKQFKNTKNLIMCDRKKKKNIFNLQNRNTCLLEKKNNFLG